MTYEPKADDRLVTLHPPCAYCKHLRTTGTQVTLEGWTCSAFPEGIPYVILAREPGAEHTKVLEDWQEGTDVYESAVYEREDGRRESVTYDGRWQEEK